MRGLYIIVEGPTEEEFVNNLLRLYFIPKGIYDVRAIKIQTSPGHKGGDLKYDRYKPTVEKLLKQESDILVTSLIDYYRLKTDFPKYNKAKSIANINERVTYIEKAVSESLNAPRFVPYIQVHEFEGILFSAKNGFEYLPEIPERNLNELINIVNGYANPESINEGEETHPSKRLENLIPGYQKTFHGPMIAIENGIQSIIDRCPRFKNWTQILIEKFNA
jgi:hypothetical protein